MQLHTGILRSITGHLYLKTLRELGGFIVVDDCVNLVRSVDEIFTTALHHIQRHYWFVIEVSEVLLFSIPIFYRGYIFQEDSSSGERANHNVLQFLWVFKLTGHAKVTA